MFKPKYKQTILAAAMLTAFCASAAFAADNAETAATKAPIKERVASILHCDEYNNGCRNYGSHWRHGGRYNNVPQLTEEQIKERREARAKWQAERRAAHEQYVKEVIAQLPQDERAGAEKFLKDEQQYRDQMRERWEKLTPAQRDVIRCCHAHFREHNYPHHREHGRW